MNIFEIFFLVSSIVVCKMSRVSKGNMHKAAQIRLRIHRGIRSIMKKDEEYITNVTCLKNKVFESIGHSSDEKENHTQSFSNQLRSWALDFNIQRRAVSALLKILIAAGFMYLPKDSRALLKTPRFIDIESRAGGQYWHHGIENSLRKIFAKLNTNIKIALNFNIDGLPLFKSSPIGFWPILGNIHGS